MGETDDLFVGRQEVMVYLSNALDSVIDGRGSILMLRGEAGIGKTRCAMEFSKDVIQRGYAVWLGRCSETASQPPFWPWIQILRNARSEQSDDPVIGREASRLLSSLVPHEGVDSGHQQSDDLLSTTDKFWLYDRLFDFLRISCIAAPRILIVDDIHWADEASLEFLSFIAPEAAGLNLLIVITLRDFEEIGSRDVYLNHLLRYAKHIPLVGLSEDNIEKYVSKSGFFECNEELNRAFFQKTGGNPLFLQETLRWLQWSTAKDKRELTAEDIRQLDVPDSVEKLLRFRLDSLDEKTRSVLDIASVVGRSFDLGLVSQSLREDKRTLVAAFERARRAGIVIQESATRFRFSHDLICEVAYERIPNTTRSDYHNRIAEVLLNRPEVDENIGKAAFHLYRALPLSDIETTIKACLKAADQSTQILAHADSAVYYRWALEAMSLSRTVDPYLRTRTLVYLGKQTRMSSADAEYSKRLLKEALQMARAYGFFDIVHEIAFIGRATFLSAHIRRPSVLEALEEGLKQVPEDDKTLRVRLLSQLALTPPYSTDIDRCKRTSQQAVHLAEELGDKTLIRVALNATLCSFTGPDDIDDLLKTADRISALHSDGEWSLAGMEARTARALAYIHRGDLEKAKTEVEAFGELVKRWHQVEGHWLYQRLHDQFTLDEGRFDEALQQFAELAKRAERRGLYYFESVHRIQRAHIMRARGATIEHVRDLYTHTIDRFRNAFTHAEIIGLIIEMGFSELVRDAYTRLIEAGLDRIPRNHLWLNALSNLALATIAFDDQQTMKELYERLKPYSDFNTPNSLFLYDGSVSHYLGLLASKLDSEAKVIHYFEQAIAANQRMSLRPQLLRSQVAFSEWLNAYDGKKYKSRLSALVTEARDSAQAMKNIVLLHRLETLGRFGSN